VPAAQVEQTVLLAALNVPAGQTRQEVLAVVFENVPPTHRLQIELPFLVLYEPGSQAVQALLPLLLLYQPAGHMSHVCAVVALLNDPAAHGRHTLRMDGTPPIRISSSSATVSASLMMKTVSRRPSQPPLWVGWSPM
jgi:hypothetical protein